MVEGLCQPHWSTSRKSSIWTKLNAFASLCISQHLLGAIFKEIASNERHGLGRLKHATSFQYSRWRGRRVDNNAVKEYINTSLFTKSDSTNAHKIIQLGRGFSHETSLLKSPIGMLNTNTCRWMGPEHRTNDLLAGARNSKTPPNGPAKRESSMLNLKPFRFKFVFDSIIWRVVGWS